LTAFLLRWDSVINLGILTESSKAAQEQAEAERVRFLRAFQGGHNALDKVVSFLPDMVGRFKFLVGDLATVRQR